MFLSFFKKKNQTISMASQSQASHDSINQFMFVEAKTEYLVSGVEVRVNKQSNAPQSKISKRYKIIVIFMIKRFP